MIKIRNFTKKYEQFLAVDRLDLDIEAGEIFGFIGPNGAGKSTTIRFLATLLDPTAGKAFINGYSVTDDVESVRRSIGYMPDTFGVYDGMRVWEFLDFFALAYGVDRKTRTRVIGDVLDLLDLAFKRDDFVNGLSRGMQQRLCLAKTLLHDPPVLILDEPASGLDPRARVEMKELLRELRNMGKTILISSHILSELADFSTRVGIIERGKLLACGSVSDVTKSVREHRVIHISVYENEQVAEIVLRRHPRVRDVHAAGGGSIQFSFDGDDSELIGLQDDIRAQGARLLFVEQIEATLEEVFMTVTKGDLA
ncbi:MAG: ABC transporter ATP-binding protein [Planctomycetota bacterium]